MSAPADVIAEMRTLGIGGSIDDDCDDLPEEKGVNGFATKAPSAIEVAKHRKMVVEISRMADKMSNLVQEIRNTTRETDDRLRQMEADLSILGLEK